MRLTLRTLLAYLDDCLNADDAQELGRKIDESQFASQLVHRIRSASRKLRMGAPRLAGKGMGLDPNTVAEYLDCTLPQDRVPDFEKVCLESDVHLAEVASCHQILTLVEVGPAEYDPVLPHKMYRIHTREPETTGKPSAAETVPPESTVEVRVEPPKVRRERRYVGFVATLVVTFLAALATLFALGPPDADHPLLGRWFESESEPLASEDGVPAGDDGGTRSDATGTAATDDDGEDAAEEGPESPIEPPDETESDASAEGPPGGVAPTPGDAESADVEPVIPEPSSTGTESVDNGDEASTEEGAGAPEEAGPGAEAVGPGEEEPPQTPDAASLRARTGVDIGRFTSDEQLLARYDSNGEIWLRLAPRSPLLSGDEVLVLPTFRPQVLMAPGVQLVLVGPARVTFLAPNAEGVPGVRMDYGRALVFTDGEEGSALYLETAGPSGVIGFSDRDATALLSVQPYVAPGSDPATTPPQTVVEIRSQGGRVDWNDGRGAQQVGEARWLVLVDDLPPRMYASVEFPDWVDPRNLSFIDRDASKNLNPMIAGDRPVTLSLQEALEHRRAEVRSLALRSLAQLDYFDPFVDAISDRNYRAYWQVQLDALRQAMQRSPSSATQVQQTIERLRPEQAERINRLLIGFAPEQLAAGGATELLTALEDQDMDVRVLAFDTLHGITDKMLHFRPEREPEQQRPALRDWQRLQEEGELVYKEPPGPYPPGTPLDPGGAAEESGEESSDPEPSDLPGDATTR